MDVVVLLAVTVAAVAVAAAGVGAVALWRTVRGLRAGLGAAADRFRRGITDLQAELAVAGTQLEMLDDRRTEAAAAHDAVKAHTLAANGTGSWSG